MRAILISLGCVALAGCSSEADGGAAAPAVPLCDGSSTLTLRIFYQGGGLDYPGSEVRVENGHPSLAVDGQCRYFMSGGWTEDRQSRDLGWRQGLLPDELRRALEQRAGSEDLQRTYGYSSGPPALDAPSAVIANARSAFIGGDGRQPVLDFFAFIRQNAPVLWATGQALDGDLHILLREPSGGEPPRRYELPSGFELRDDIEPASPVEALSGEGWRGRVPRAEAAAWRTIREQYLRDTAPAGAGYTSAGIPVTDGELSATLFMRDALPYEDEQGLLPLPGN